ncbi:MAG: GtrA family protein [Pseudomonadota bacterium]
MIFLNRRVYDTIVSRYLLGSIVATLVDWGVFHFFTDYLDFSYPWALLISMGVGSIVSFSCNKLFAFRCHSKRVKTQFLISIVVVISAFLLSLLLMAIMVEFFHFKLFISRVLTTLIVFVWNFLLNRYLTFCKRFFS